MFANSKTCHSFTDATRGLRLQKVMAAAGVASRRQCEKLISEQRVRVNGQLVSTLPAWVHPHQDVIEVDGQPVHARTPRSQDRRPHGAHTYVLLHKPPRVISTSRDPEGRTCVLDLVSVPNAQRLFVVGRLDADSTGLMLLTNDGELAHRITHPRYGIAKCYQVKVRGRLTVHDLKKLRQGLVLAHGTRTKRASADRVDVLRHEKDRARGDRTTLAITLREGQNREIRRLLARLGFKVSRLKRLSIGPLNLKGLMVGQWRPLRNRELEMLRRAAGCPPSQSELPRKRLRPSSRT